LPNVVALQGNLCVSVLERVLGVERPFPPSRRATAATLTRRVRYVASGPLRSSR
jgi:hypothetical protein